jgi:glycosyltransferase involved in cell wall biosynthesis
MPAYIHGLQEIRQGRVDLIYSTGGAWSAHLAALWLKKKTNLPWIAEIHDPLVIRKNPNDQGFEKPKNRDARFRHYLEQQLCKYADLVWWFTDGALHYAKVRNTNLNTTGNAHGVVVIPGAEPPVQKNTQSSPQSNAQQHHYGDKLHLCHFGSLAKDRSLSTILKAAAHLIASYPEARQCLVVDAYGAPLDDLSKSAIAQYEFDDLLIAHGRLEKDPITGKSGRERVLGAMQSADVLILLHGNDEWCAEYIPSKFYEYLWAGRPIWAISHRNPQLDSMLQKRGAYLSHAENEEDINFTLERIWLDWRKQQLIKPEWFPIGVDQAARKILSLVDSIKEDSA